VLKEKTVVGFIVAFKKDRDLPTKVWPIVHSILSVLGSGEHRKTSATRGREKINSIRATPQVSSLQDEIVRLWGGRVDESIGEIIKVSKINERHENINVIRPFRLFKVFSIRDKLLLGRSWQESIAIRNGNEPIIPIRLSFTITATANSVHLENQFLRVIFFLRVRAGSADSHSDSSRNDEPADGALMVGGEAEGAEQPSRRAALSSRVPSSVHGGSGDRGKRGLRRGRRTRVRGGRGAGGRELTTSLLVPGLMAAAAAHRIPTRRNEVVGREATEAAPDARAEGEVEWLGAGVGRA
jgi:hypothetical protein